MYNTHFNNVYTTLLDSKNITSFNENGNNNLTFQRKKLIVIL